MFLRDHRLSKRLKQTKQVNNIPALDGVVSLPSDAPVVPFDRLALSAHQWRRISASFETNIAAMAKLTLSSSIVLIKFAVLVDYSLLVRFRQLCAALLDNRLLLAPSQSF
jgi:hypothetical protein